MKNIVIPVDFSAHSFSASKTGAFLARKTGAKIHILHVVDGPPDWERISGKRQQENTDMLAKIDSASEQLEKFSNDKIFQGLGLKTHIRGGVPYSQIVELAKDEQADLIVIGAHGAGESHTVFIGSTNQRVMRSAPCPVLSVKKNFNPTTIRKIIFPSDFEEDIQATIRTMKNFASDLKASVELTFINTPGKFVDSETIEKKMQKVIPKQNEVKFTSFVYNDYNKESGIVSAAKKRNGNIIAMVTHNRNGKPSYLLGITETLLYHSELPVLSLMLK